MRNFGAVPITLCHPRKQRKRRRGQAIEAPRGQNKSPLAGTRSEIGLLQTMQLVCPRIFLPKFSLGKFWKGKRRRGRSIEVPRGQNKSPLAGTRGEIGLLQTMQLVYPRLFLLKFSLGKFWEGKRRRGRSKGPSSSGRDDRIRTCDLCVPNAALYQTEPHLDNQHQTL